MNRRFQRLLQFLVFGLDVLVLNLVVMVFHLLLDRTQNSYVVGYIRFWMWLNIAWLLMTRLTDTYAEKHISVVEVFFRVTMRSYFYWVALATLYLFFARQFELSRLYISLVMAAFGCMLLVNRFLYLGLHQRLRHHQRLTRRIMILGFNETARRLAAYLEEERINIEIVGFCEEAANVRQLSHYPILGSVADSLALSESHQVNEIYSTIAPEQDPGIYSLMRQADDACISFRVVPDLGLYMRRQVHVDFLRDLPMLSLRKEPMGDAGNRIRKRLFDIAVSLLVIAGILSWLLPLVALLIRLESRGPVFFRQPRTGRGRRPFNCLKFRSMRVNAESHQLQATRNDKRLTRVGRFLRRTNLDEFPQFINVLRGEMSIVGPRPHMLKHTDEFSKMVDDYMVRQFVKPGITGWAQVNGFRGETTRLSQLQGRVSHDLWYVENWSLWLDVRILFLTVWTTLRGDKNAF